MGSGLRCGSRTCKQGRAPGIGWFVRSDGAYTTLAAAVAIAMVLTLTFSAVTAIWSLSKSEEVQVCADTTALAGANVVSSYTTAATVLDACSLSLGLAGLCLTGVGMVGMFVPGAAAPAAQALEAGLDTLRMRNDFTKSVSKGLETVEKALPYLVAANSAKMAGEYGRNGSSYTGVALALPVDSASEFSALAAEQMDVDALEGQAESLREVADELEEVQAEVAEAKQAAWIADCGRDGANMQERAAALSGLSAAENPDYETSIAWEPSVGLERARVYYRWRLEHEEPLGSGIEEQVDSTARTVFYELAVDMLDDAFVGSDGEGFSADVEPLPRNTDEMRETAVYTDVRWPTTYEAGGLVLHYAADCPGATGASGPALALSSIDGGQARECAVCRFSIGDVGRVPAASTSIDNGFEYHFREFVLALKDYESCRAREEEVEHEAYEQADDAGDGFEQALSGLSAKRPRIAPPGRYGCVAFVASGEDSSSESLETAFSTGARLGSRGAVSAAVLAPDKATAENNVLSRFFSRVEGEAGDDGAVGLLGSVMDLWGSLLVSYGDAAAGVSEAFDGLLDGFDAFGAGALADWFAGRLSDVVAALGFEPVDLRLRKPVLTNSSNVLNAAGAGGLVDVQGLLRSIPIGSADVADIARAVGYEIEEYVGSAEFTIAEIPIPGTGSSIPLTVRLGDIGVSP